jgi:hypothetical protein
MVASLRLKEEERIPLEILGCSGEENVPRLRWQE